MFERITASLQGTIEQTLGMVASRARALAYEAPGFPTRLPHQVPELTLYERALLRRAASTKPEHRLWTPDSPLRSMRIAHRTNSAADLRSALRSNYNVLEGDVRLDRSGRPVMAHDKSQLNGMRLDDWLFFAASSGRAVKVDIKDPDAIVPTLKALRKHHVSGNRLVLNVSVGPADDKSNASVGELRLLRTAYPKAVINLSHQSYPYSKQTIRQLGAIADFVGGRVMFPLRADKVDRKLVESLGQYGAVGIWNTPVTYNPSRKQISKDVRRFRDWGVLGAIDIRRA